MHLVVDNAGHQETIVATDFRAGALDFNVTIDFFNAFASYQHVEVLGAPFVHNGDILKQVFLHILK